MLFQLLFQEPLIFFPLIGALLIALSVHEVAHGVVAYALGDSTAKDQGRLSFNPIKHIDPMGAILLLFVGFGWGKPVPVNYYNLKYPKWGPALVAIAGPISNLIMVLVFGFLFMAFAPQGLNPVNLNQVILTSGNLMLIFLSFLVVYNAILMVFNLIPIPPLDGSKIFFSALPPRYEYIAHWLSNNGPMLLFGLLIFDTITNIGIFSGIFNWILALFAQIFI